MPIRNTNFHPDDLVYFMELAVWMGIDYASLTPRQIVHQVLDRYDDMRHENNELVSSLIRSRDRHTSQFQSFEDLFDQIMDENDSLRKELDHSKPTGDGQGSGSGSGHGSGPDGSGAAAGPLDEVTRETPPHVQEPLDNARRNIFIDHLQRSPPSYTSPVRERRTSAPWTSPPRRKCPPSLHSSPINTSPSLQGSPPSIRTQLARLLNARLSPLPALGTLQNPRPKKKKYG